MLVVVTFEQAPENMSQQWLLFLVLAFDFPFGEKYRTKVQNRLDVGGNGEAVILSVVLVAYTRKTSP